MAACCTVAFSRAVDPKLWLAGLDTPEMVFGLAGEEFRLFSSILVVVLLAGILLGGLFGDLLGRRRVMLLSLVVSTATSLAAQIVVDTPWLTILHLLAAATGAMALPLTLAVIRLTFEGRERQVAMFIYTVVCEGALLVALVALVQVIEGDLLASVLPTVLSVIGLYLAWRHVPESRASQHLRQHAATSVAWALTFLPLTLAFVAAQLSNRWTNPVTLVAAAIGCIGLVSLALAWRGRIRVSATANIRRRRRHLLSVMLLTAAALTLGITGYAVELYRFFSIIQGYGNVVGGLALVPMLAGVLVTARRASDLAFRLGARRVIAGGLALMGTAMLATALIRPDAGYWLLVLPLGVFGTGYLVAQTAWTIAFMNEMPDAVVGASAAIAQATSSTGAALGGALLGITLHEIGQARLDRRLAELHLSAEQMTAARATLEGVLRGDVALPASDAARQALFGAYADSYTAGLAAGLLIGAIICLLAAATAWFGLELQQPARASSSVVSIDAGLGDLV
jgi:MFS transporter, DHA2 family, multidrug resistance protein